jgi:hypothetical protein
LAIVAGEGDEGSDLFAGGYVPEAGSIIFRTGEDDFTVRAE